MMQRIPSFIFRRKAWLSIKPRMQVLIVVGLLAVLPGLIGQVLMQTNENFNNDLNTILTRLEEVTYGALELPAEGGAVTAASTEESAEGGAVTAASTEESAAEKDVLQTPVDEVYGLLGDFLKKNSTLLVTVLVLQLLVSPMMMVTLYGALLKSLRNQDVSIGGSLAMLRCGPKMLLLQLWMMLRIMVWMLPGMAAMVVGALLFIVVPVLGEVLLLAAYVAAFVLAIRAALHYALAPFVLADKLETSLNGCIRVSHQAMRSRKMEFFLLMISFVWWDLLVTLVGSITVLGVVSMALGMMGSLMLNIYRTGAQLCFYDCYVCHGESAQQAAPGESPEDENLN